jgi:hypothetical protein
MIQRVIQKEELEGEGLRYIQQRCTYWSNLCPMPDVSISASPTYDQLYAILSSNLETGNT